MSLHASTVNAMQIKRAKISSVDLKKGHIIVYHAEEYICSLSPCGVSHEPGGIANGIEYHIEGVPQSNTENCELDNDKSLRLKYIRCRV